MLKGDLDVRASHAMKRDEIIGRILDRERNQQPLNARAICSDEPALYAAARRHFGSWRRALEFAGQGAGVACRRRAWNRQRVISYIRRLASRCGSLRSKDIRARDSGFVRAAYKLFGSWQAALEAAGVNAEQYCTQPRWTREQLVEAILLRAVKREPLGSTTVTPTSLRTAAVAEFGSWTAALTAAGLNPEAHVGYASRSKARDANPYRTREEIKRALLQRHALGHDCDRSAVCKQDRRLFRAIRRLFGRCDEAMRYAGIVPREELE